MSTIIQITSYLIINLIVIFFFNLLSKYFNLFDYPNQKRKKQVKPISLFGGFIFVINFSLIIFFDITFNNDYLINYLGLNSNLKLLSFVILFYIIYLIGYADDKFDLRPFTKLLLITFCLYMIVQNNQNIVINSLRSILFIKEIDLFFLGPSFTIFCILCYMNAMNMFDGINLVSFLHFLSVAIIIIIDNNILNFGLVLLFSLLIFGYLNFKNLSYLGDSGVYVLSLISAIFLIIFYKNNNINAENILIIIYLPIIDFIRLFFVRIYKGVSPFLSDEKHFHHLLKKKYNYKKAVIIISILLYLPIMLSYLFNFTLLILLLFTIIYFILLNKLQKKSI